jgi:putative ABC transport system substrate-binding protein
MFPNLGSLIAQRAAQHRIAVVSGDRAVAEAGALIAHVPPTLEACRRAAAFVDRILKGARPADLPLEPSTRFQTVINLRVARALGLTIPASALRLADEVIQ